MNLGLSEQQFNIVINAANNVAPEHRSRFLDAVVDRLFGRNELDNADVQDAIKTTLDRLGVPK